MRISFKLILLAFAVTTATSLLHADSLKEIAAALDIDTSYFTAQGYIKYKYDSYGDLVYDANDKPVIAKREVMHPLDARLPHAFRLHGRDLRTALP